ncbi:MAG: alpha-glucan family phosphorylase [Bacteroidetes bacterium]|nr:MAG: alpha-glucan family phosphorylase [Bacteroidota bacterium]
MNKTDIIFEVSWEVCNKVGGINTVIATKAKSLINKEGDNLILIGPDLLKEEGDNQVFIEDESLLSNWHSQASSEGLKFRIGRWNIAGNPIAILVDFTPYFSRKDGIFKDLWEKYGLDSLQGEWDYIEPTMFGYAAAEIIKSYHDFFLSTTDKVVAQFHEWMTGSGILYLKDKAPHIATTFTTHATILGRTIAGNKLPLYGNLDTYHPQALAKRFNIIAKYSLESISAREADSFTTVSDITANECKYLLQKEPDIVTPNGFEDSFVPKGDEYGKKRDIARAKLNDVVEAALGYKLNNPYFVINSGRYEFKNKGIDVFIKALKKLNDEASDDSRDIVAVIAVPAHHSNPNNVLMDRLNGNENNEAPQHLTHYLFDEQYDPSMNLIKELQLNNAKEDKVKVIFAPVYLDGRDGVFNLEYYDLLIGFDLSVFPSYYEPWGYTPMESLAFSIPTITTTLAGFGIWIKEKVQDGNNGAVVIERDDQNDIHPEIANGIKKYFDLGVKEHAKANKDAFELSRLALWKNLVGQYHKAYNLALENADERIEKLDSEFFHKPGTKFQQIQSESPKWKKLLIKSHLSEKLQPLMDLASNLWWTWNFEAAALFKSVDPDLWIEVEHNPVALIEALEIEDMEQLENNEEFMAKLSYVHSKFVNYMNTPKENHDKIAYFSMEFGLHDTIKIFSGGLGILAGDYIKEASDNNMDLTAVGLLYRYGYFRQKITLFGDQLATFSPQKFSHLPLVPVRDENGEWVSINISLPGRVLYARAWVIHVGRVKLYLLDTDIESNNPADRKITHQLYGGDQNNRFLQELLLGVGGIRLLDAIKQNASMYHCNEGHAAMIGLERLRKFINDENLSFNEAKEVVRASTLFTTHTPVPAGHDRFDEDMIRTYLPHYADRLHLSWNDFMGLGRVNTNDLGEKFSMSVLAAKLSQGMNGVSRIHGRVSREMFADMFPGYYPNELYIDYVTNGVHLPTWASKKWAKLYQSFDKGFFEHQEEQDKWNQIYDVDDEKIWDLRKGQRKKLIDYLKVRLENEMTARQETPRLMLKTLRNLRDDVLTIGFARRFATYKRAHLLFNNLERLDLLINNKERPIQFIFAGKAHPADKAGQDLIKRIVEISKMPQFVGKIIFVENYDISLAKRLISGVDVWLNNPTRPLEASGTSGEKAIMNGVLNLSVLDGWWAEGYTPGAGWALTEERTYTDQDIQNVLDASMLYQIMEDDIAPLFYDNNENDLPVKWIQYVKKNIADIAPRFTMKRMIDDYIRKYYAPQIERSKLLLNDNYKKTRELVQWKEQILNQWSNIEVLEVKYPDSSIRPLNLGEIFEAHISLRLNGIDPKYIGVEIVSGDKEDEEVKKITNVFDLQLDKMVDDVAIYKCDIQIKKSGVVNFAFRVFPKHELLPHRQDFPLLKWI